MNSIDRRAVITGLGVVAPNGIGKDLFWDGLMSARNSIRRVTRFEVGPFASHLGGEVPDFHPHTTIPNAHLPYLDRAYQFGVTAAIEAVNDAGLNFDQE